MRLILEHSYLDEVDNSAESKAIFDALELDGRRLPSHDCIVDVTHEYHDTLEKIAPIFPLLILTIRLENSKAPVMALKLNEREEIDALRRYCEVVLANQPEQVR